MVYKNIVTKRTWQDKSGNEKTKWFVVGTLKETNDNKQFIELNMFPDTAFYVFDQKKKEPERAPSQRPAASSGTIEEDFF